MMSCPALPSLGTPLVHPKRPEILESGEILASGKHDATSKDYHASAGGE